MWYHPGDHCYCADGQSQFRVSIVTKNKFDWRNDMKICSYGPRFWVQTSKKNIRLLPSNQKKSPLPTFNPQRFSERSICHTTFCSRHLRKNWRNWRELCKVLSRPWMASDFLPPTVMALNFRRRWDLGALVAPQGTTLYRSQKKV